MLLYWTINFIKMLSRDDSNAQYGLGIAFGLLLGFIPCVTLHWVLILTLALVLRVNLAATFFSMIFFTGPALLFDAQLARIGYWLLHDLTSLTPLWARLYHAPLFPFTRFNSTLVMGSTAFAFTGFLPTFLVARALVKGYREQLHTYWLSTRINRSYAHIRRFAS